MNYREFRSRYRMIPFGKFSSSGRGRSPFNQIFVGRINERASIIEALTHQEKFGALLVSGRRGSGKTSFVDYVLDEYRRSAFHRFIRFSRRNGVADLFAATATAIFLALLLAIVTQSQELLILNAAYALDTPGDGERYWWVFVALIAFPIMATGLLIFAMKGYAAVAMLARRGTNSSAGGILLSAIVTVLAIDTLLLGSFMRTHVVSGLETIFAYLAPPVIEFFLAIGRIPPAVLVVPAAVILTMICVAVDWLIERWRKRKGKDPKNIQWSKVPVIVMMLTFTIPVGITIFLWFGDRLQPHSGGVVLAAIACMLIGFSIFAFSRLTRVKEFKPIHQYLLRIRYALFGTGLLVALPMLTSWAGFHGAGHETIFTPYLNIIADQITATFVAIWTPIISWADPLLARITSSTAPYTGGLGDLIGVGFAAICALILAQAVASIIPVRESESQPDNLDKPYRWVAERTYRHGVALFELILTVVFFTFLLPERGGLQTADVPLLALQFVSAIAVLAGTDMLRLSARRKPRSQVSRGWQLVVMASGGVLFLAWIASWILATDTSTWNLAALTGIFTGSAIILLIKARLLVWRNKAKDAEVWLDPRMERTGFHNYSFYNRTPLELVLVAKSVILTGLAIVLLVPFMKLAPNAKAWIPQIFEIDYTIGAGGVASFIAMIALLFCVEYSWISRGMRSERQDQPIVPLGKEPNEAQIDRLWSQTEEWPATRKPDLSAEEHDHDVRPDWWDSRAANPLASGRDQIGLMSARRREIARAVEAATLSCLFYQTRVPVIISRINLGFDDLHHSRIVEAMLVQLRDRYKEQFVAVSSRIGLGTFLLTVALLIALTKIVSDNFFEVPKPTPMEASTMPETGQAGFLELRNVNAPGPSGYDYCGYFRGLPASRRPLANGAICVLPWSNAIYDLLYTPVLLFRPPSEFTASFPEDYEVKITEKSLIFDLFLDINNDLPVAPEKTTSRTTNDEIANSGSPALRVYHILIFVLLAILLQRLNKIVKLRPYTYRVREMERLIELIRGRVTQTNSDTPRVGWLQWALGLRQRDERIETAPDPRVVEQSFIDLLLSINPDHRGERAPLSNWFETRPELVFVFDEMDKLSGKIDPETARGDEATAAVEENTRERQRAMQLHELLSDMKRLLSSNSARFVFIGSRLYHDEWLADQVDRTPLLTSIFSEQVYLPSLLTDREHSYGRFNDRIGEYFILMFRNAADRLRHWKLKRQALPFVGAPGLMEPTYVQGTLPHSGHPRRTAMMAHYVGMRVYDEDGRFYGSENRSVENAQNPLRRSGDSFDLTRGETETIEQFINFLTYRSAGNPKKMKEILQSMVKPSSKAFDLPRYGKRHQRDVRFRMQNSHHDCITMDDKSLYRVQFIDLLYRHLTEHLESRMMERDDKVAMSVFYLMDFLLKFHNRGFSWTNLQRVDELSHIHRAPDLRSMMGVLVDASSERFLHRVLNGVYAFRFRSDFAREIDYLSRISKEEMAALNFTLDESQDLKGLYQDTIRRGEHENVDTISGLGELYEYDQDYEIARNYYRRAMVVLDRSYMDAVATEFDTGPGENPEPISQGTLRQTRLGVHGTYTSYGDDGTKFKPLGIILQNPHSAESQRAIRSNFSWAIARVRLLLQIGHTYEQERNYERALASYMHAHRLSQAVLLAVPAQDPSSEDENEHMSERVITPQNYSILYQAALAGAWIFEKGNQDADDSIAHAERAILWLYERNPALRLQNLRELRERPGTLRRATFSIRLFASDMHDRLGDLYFYKGKQSTRMIDNWETYQTADRYSHASLRFGYLIRAHHHYAMSIWNIRNYLGLRTRSSTARLNLLEEGSGWEERTTIKFDGTFPDLVHNNLANGFTDMSEAILARAAMGELLRSFMSMGKSSGKWSVVLLREEAARYRSDISQCVNRFIRNLPQTPDTNLDKSEGLTGYDLFDLFDANGRTRPVNLINRDLRGSDAITWLGDGKNWPTADTDYSLRSSLIFRTITTQDERLNAATFFSSVAAKNFAIAGYNIDAANEYLLQAQTLVGLLWTIRQLEWLAGNAPSAAQEQIRKMLFPANLRDRLKAFSKDTASLYRAEIKQILSGHTDDRELATAWIDFLSSAFASPVGPNGEPLSETWREFCATAEATSKDYKRFDTWRKAPNSRNDPFGTAKLQIGTMAHVSLLRAMSAIQTSHRTSATRFAQNHGDPNVFERDLLREFREFLIEVLLESTDKKYSASIYDLAKPHSNPENSALSDEKLLFEARAWRGLDRLLDYLLTDKRYKNLKNNRSNATSRHLSKYSDFISRLRELRDRKRNSTKAGTKVAKAGREDIEYHSAELESDYQLSQPWRDEPRLATLSAQLVLALGDMDKDNANSDTDKLAALIYDDFLNVNGAGRYTKRSNDEIEADAGLSAEKMRETYNTLHRQTEIFRFPVLNRLRALRVLSDAAVIHGHTIMEKPEWVKTAPKPSNNAPNPDMKDTWGDDEVKRREHAALIGRLCRELSHTAEIYDSENHFSPHLQGTSLAMAYFYCLKDGRRVLYDTATGDAWDDQRVAQFAKPGYERNWRDKPTLSAAVITREAMGEMAVNMLRRSEQMYSMGKAYYENISSLQYLNDDFNDRITHYNQATRMMYSELIGTMIAAVHDDIFKK